MVGVCTSEFHFVAPSAVLVPDNVSAVPIFLKGPDGWVPSVVLEMVDWHKKAEQNGSWASSNEVLIFHSCDAFNMRPIE